MKTYLSIDVDYFAHHFNATEMRKFFNRVLQINAPTYVVVNHQHLVNHVDQFDYDKLVNLDFHSDLTDAIDFNGIPYDYTLGQKNAKTNYWPEEFECGTWVNFCKRRNMAEFVWHYPHEICFEYDGQCLSSMYEDYSINRKFIAKFWREGSCNNFHNWVSATRKKGYSSIFSDEIVGIGIALSPDWSKEAAEMEFMENILPKFIQKGAELDTQMGDYIEQTRETRLDKHLW